VTSSIVPLFAYGTLQRGHAAHERLCRGALIEARPAAVRGRLWRLPPGYAVVEVPPESVLLESSGDFADDQRKMQVLAMASGGSAAAATLVRGELLLLRGDPAQVLPPLDRWEEFSPKSPTRGCYRRVAVSVELEDGSRQAAWCYIANLPLPPGSEPVNGERWIG
jgi:gamma-glutamylcyclotransferase (GGCT)/AIG2-like uncharacterized protein YtfP